MSNLITFKDFLALEMAMGDRKVYNIPILFDESDLEFLHQFPTICPQTNTDIWTLALKWRYGEGLLQVSEFFSAKWRGQGGKPEDVDMSDFPDEREVVFYEWRDVGPVGNKKKEKVFKFNFGKKKTGSLSLFYRLQDKGGLDMDLTDPIRKAAASEEELDKYIAKTSSGQLHEPDDRDEPAHFNETVTAAQYQAMLRNLTVWALANQHKIITPPQQFQGQVPVEKDVNLGLGKGKEFKLPTIKQRIDAYSVKVLVDLKQKGRVGAEGPKYTAKRGEYDVKAHDIDAPVLGKGRFVIPVTVDRSKFLRELLGYDPDLNFVKFFTLPLLDSTPGTDPQTGKIRPPRTVETLRHILETNIGQLNISRRWFEEILKRVLLSPSIGELNMGNLILALNPKSAMSQWGRKKANLRTDTKGGEKGEASQKLDNSNLLYNWDLLSDQDKETLKTPVNDEQRMALIKAGKKQKAKLSDPDAEEEIGEEETPEGLAKWAFGFSQPSKGISRQGSQNWTDAYGSEKAEALGDLQMQYFSAALHILGGQYSGWITEIGGRPLSKAERDLIPTHHEDFAAAMAARAINLDIDKTLEEIEEGKGVTSRGKSIMYGKLNAMLQKAAQTYDTGQSAQSQVGGDGEGDGSELGDQLADRPDPLSASGEGKLKKGANTKLKSDVWHNKFQLSLFKRLNKNDEKFLKEHLSEIEDKLSRIKAKYLDDEIKKFTKPGAIITPEVKVQFEKSAEAKALMVLIPHLEKEHNFKFMAIKTAPDLAQALQMIRSLGSRGGEVEDAKTLDQLIDLSDYSPGVYSGSAGVTEKENKTKKLKEFADSLTLSNDDDDEETQSIDVLDWIDKANEDGLTAKEIEIKIVPTLLAIKTAFADGGVDKQDMQIYWVKAIKEIKNELNNLEPSAPQTPPQTQTQKPIQAGRSVMDDPAVADAKEQIKKRYTSLLSNPHIAAGMAKWSPQDMNKFRNAIHKWGAITKNDAEAQMMYRKLIEILQSQGVKVEMSLPMGYPPYGNRIRQALGNCANVWGVPNQSTGVGPTEKPIQNWTKKFKSLKEYLQEHELDGYKQMLRERVEKAINGK
jgi:hypothetical protein